MYLTYMSPLPRTYSQRWNTAPPDPQTLLRNAGTQQFQYPTSLSSLFTQQVRNIGIQARADASGHAISIPESFAQLRNDLTNDNFLSALGKFAVDDPARLYRLALSILRENKRARNNLASLHAARTCMLGARQLGDRKWYTDKPGIAKRLKSQTQRRQFRLGLIANLAFYNQLNIGDLHSLLHSGDPSGLASISNSTPTTIPALRAITALASPYDILRVLAPEKAAGVASTLRQISALSDYVQSLCGYLAGNEALEPAHEVICKLLRTGADFERAKMTNPIHVAAAAVAPLCPHPDVDGILNTKPSPTPDQRTNKYPRGYCWKFQDNLCRNYRCRFKHLCASCQAPGHGKSVCSNVI